MRTLTTRGAALALALTLGLGLAACGSDDDEPATPDTTSADGATSINRDGLVPSTEPDPGDTTAETGEPVRLGTTPDPVPGVIGIDGGSDTLTRPVKAAFGASPKNAGITVQEAASGETRAMQRLCVGEIDIVDAARPMTAAEYEQCRRAGLDVVQFQVAADAIVLAIKSQSDVGTDCLSTDQVKAGFQNGSAITSWSQLGSNLDDVPFAAGGPTVVNNAARFFARYLLEDPEPVNSDFRVDYVGTDDEDGTRGFVTGNPRDVLASADLASVTPTWQQLRKDLQVARGVWKGKQNEVEVSQAEQRKGIRTGRSVKDRAKDDQRVADAFAERGVAITQVHSIQAKLRPIDTSYQRAAAAQRRLDATNGHVGLFSQGYYATYENLLRPFEIEIFDGDDEPNCIFPSAQTILNGEYPLSRQLLLTVSTRALQRPEVRKFLSFYLASAQATATDRGLVPLPNADIARQQEWLTDATTLPRFGSVDGGAVQEITDESESEVEAPSAPAAVKPAR